MTHTLSLDIGGTSIKCALLDKRGQLKTKALRIVMPRPATPRLVLETINDVADTLATFERVSVGFPGVVVDGVTRTAPNLHDEWRNFPLAKTLTKRLRRPARVINDAGMHGFAVIKRKGAELVLTLGTGVGCAFYLDGAYVPNLELAHHPFDDKHTYEGFVGLRTFEKIGKKRWNQRMKHVLVRVEKLFNPDDIYLGGGLAMQLEIPLPRHAQIVDNAAGVRGGAALWQ
jgi:polyphosphate glucokinase